MSVVVQDAMKLRACLEAVLTCYNVRPDIEGLLTTIARPPGTFRLEDVELVIDRLNFGIDKQEIRYDEILTAKLPAIIGTAAHDCFAYLPSRAAGEKLFPVDPGLDGDTHVWALFVYPLKSSTLMDVSHMAQSHSLDWFWAPIRRFYTQYGEVMLCSLFINLFVLAYPLFSMNVYDRVTVNFAESTLFVLTSGIVIVLIFDFLFKVMRSHLLENIASKVGSQYDSDLMERMIAVKITNMELSVGERANIFREMQSVRDFYASRLAPTLVDLPFFVLFIGVIFFIDPWLSVVPLVGSVLILVANLFIQIPIDKATKSYFAGMQSKSAYLIQMLTGMRTIKMMNAVGPKLFEWNIQAMKSADEAKRSHALSSIVGSFSIFITYMVSVFTLFLGAYLISQGTLTVGGLVAATMMSSRAIGPIVGLAGIVVQYKRYRDVLLSVDKIYKLPSEHDNFASRPVSNGIKGGIKFDDVSFKYPSQQYAALTKVSLNIEPGEHVGFIGRTGAGKSTLVRMVCSLLEPSSGSILVDNFGMTSYSPYELRRNIGYVPQDAFFFSGTIESNILMGCETASKEDVERAVKMSGLESVMKNTGRGLDMEVGENGDRLSGGQKQSIALARALVRNPQVLVFDEPTNGIDTSLEASIKADLTKYLKGRTFLMITHRTTLLSLVDRLVLLDKGKIIADGPRDEVLKKLGGTGV